MPYRAARERASCVEDMRLLASRRLPRAVFDFIDGAADDEATRRANRDDLAAIRLVPRYLRDVSQRSAGITILGRSAAMPLIVAPTGLASLAWPRADIAIARAAHSAGIPFVISTSSSVRLEEITGAVENGRAWFQVYLYKDRDLVRRLVQRASAAGIEALVLTVDTPVLGWRRRDHRNRFTVPLKPTAALAIDLVRCARWTWGIARHGVPRMQNFVESGHAADIASLAHLMTSNMDASVTWSDLGRLRDLWPGPIVLKGLLAPQDVAAAEELGVDAVWISNHGGRQLDGAISTVSALVDAVGAAGRMELFMDGGVRSGADVAKAVALGARAAAIGRPALYGVAMGGEPGAARVLDMIRSEYDRCLALLGRPTSGDLDRTCLAGGYAAGACHPRAAR